MITDIVDSLGVDGVSRSKQLCYASLSEYIESASQLMTVYMHHPGESVTCRITHSVIMVVSTSLCYSVSNVSKLTDDVNCYYYYYYYYKRGLLR